MTSDHQDKHQQLEHLEREAKQLDPAVMKIKMVLHIPLAFAALTNVPDKTTPLLSEV